MKSATIKRHQTTGVNSMDAIWFVYSGRHQTGPFTSADLQRMAATGRVTPNDLVWKDGMDDWAKAATIKNLFPNYAPEPPPVQNRRPEIPIKVQSEVPIKIKPPKEGIAQVVSRRVVIGWTIFCLVAYFSHCRVIASAWHHPLDRDGPFITMGAMMLATAWWFFVWIVVSIPTLVLSLVSKKR